MIDGLAIPQDVIDELERAAGAYSPRDWTDDQIAILKAYWKRVPIALLEKHCHHSKMRCYEMGAELGLEPWGA